MTAPAARVYAGVDGGGTRTRAVLVDQDGRELARAEDRGAVATATRPQDAADAVRRAVTKALAAVARSVSVEQLWAGLAGAGSPSARAGVTRSLEAMGLARGVTVGTDVEAAYHDAFGVGPGVLLIAGTGSIAWARDAERGERRVGGWGRTLGDEGSGYWMGLEAMRRTIRAADGRETATAMADDLLETCGVDSVEELVGWVEGASKAEVAALAPRVVRQADSGDAAAAEIVDRAVKELAALARVAAASSSPSPPVVLWGGLVAPGGPLRGRVRQALEGQGLRVLDRAVDPPTGAARLALEAAEG